MVYMNSKAGSLFFIVALVVLSCSGSNKKQDSGKTLPGTSPSYIEVSISGMTCTGCEQTVQKQVTGLEGVKSVTASFTSGMAKVEYYPELTDTSDIRAAITKSGYKVNKFLTSAGNSSVQ